MSILHLFSKKKICSVHIKRGHVRGEGRAEQVGRVGERVGEVRGRGAQKRCGWGGKFVCHSF